MSIITKASELTGDSTLVFGSTASGKSTFMLDKVIHLPKVLWIACSNRMAFSGRADAGHIDVAEVNTNEDWKAIAAHFKSNRYDAIVIDGLNVLMKIILNGINSGGSVEQSQWAEASNTLRNRVLAARGETDTLFAACDAIYDEEVKGKKLDLNPYAANMMWPLFGGKVYTYASPIKDAKSNKITGASYGVQTVGALAINFQKATE